MVQIIPAILTKDPDEIIEKIKFLESIPEIEEVHLDIEDGQFVPNTTVLPKSFQIPTQTRLQVEAHLMVVNPQAYFHDLEHCGINQVILHYESFTETTNLKIALQNAKILGFKTGVVINPQTEIAVFDAFMERPDFLMLMSVHPGFQGQKFLPETLERLQTLRERHPDAILAVDGGLKLENFQSVIAHGANRIVVGSGIWVTPQAGETIKKFLDKLK